MLVGPATVQDNKWIPWEHCACLTPSDGECYRLEIYHWQLTEKWILIQVKILCIALTLDYRSVCCWNKVHGNTILLCSQVYQLDFTEPCILKYLLQAQQFADLLLDEALRPMKEGLGSYITTVSDGWLTVGDPVTNHPGSQSLQLCCRNATTVQILSWGYKQTFLLKILR